MPTAAVNCKLFIHSFIFWRLKSEKAPGSASQSNIANLNWIISINNNMHCTIIVHFVILCAEIDTKIAA